VNLFCTSYQIGILRSIKQDFESTFLILPKIILLAIINRNSSYFIYRIYTKVDNFEDFVDNSVVFYPFCSFFCNFINNITCIRIFYSDYSSMHFF